MTIRSRFSRCCPLEIAHEEFPLHIVLCAGRNQKVWSISHSALNVNHLRLLLLWGLTDFRVSVFCVTELINLGPNPTYTLSGQQQLHFRSFLQGRCIYITHCRCSVPGFNFGFWNRVSQGPFGNNHGHSQLASSISMVLQGNAFKSVHHYKVLSHHMPLFLCCSNIFRVPYIPEDYFRFPGISAQSVSSIFADLCVLGSLKIQRCIISR